VSKYDRQAKRALNTGSAAWRAIRAQVLSEQPLCPLCHAEGRAVPAVDVDHKDNNPSNNARENLWGLCRSHHSEKTAVEQAGGEWQAKGCGADGWPLARS
jgi:5-methylcytosine-specific restriction protein A